MGTGGRDVEELFVQNQEREQELRTLLKTRPSESRDVQALRGEIRSAYSDMLGMDPEFCASNDVELLLWKNCYYKRIEDFRKRLRKYAHLASSLERSKAFDAREHLHSICQAFARFLGEATEFYASLLRRFEAMHRQYVKGGALGSDSGRGSGSVGSAGGGEQLRSKILRLIVFSINRCLIFLGDLARYRELHGESSVKDWSNAEQFYHQALAVLPSSGNPHNQLAVLATYTDAECVSVYRYCRSLMIESPFQTAHENLTLLFEKNKQKGFSLSIAAGGTDGKDGPTGGSVGGSSRDFGPSGGSISTLYGSGTQHHGKGKGKGSGGRGNTGALLKSFLRRFVRLHGMIFSGRADDLEDFPSIFETAIADFRTLLSNSAFGDALLLKMVVICIFSVTHVAAVQNIGAAGASGYTAPDYNALSNEAFSNAGSGVDTTSGDGGNSDRSGGGGGASGTGSGGLDTAASKADDVRRKARLSYPLALAFGVSAQIGRHVRTQEPTHPSQGSQHHAGGGGHGHGRNHIRHGSHGSAHGGPGSDSGMLPGGSGHHHHHHSGGEHVPPAPVVVYGVDSKSRPSSNQPQPRPLGSRLLGPVVLFCDWLTAQPRFLRLVEEDKAAAGSSTGNSGGGSSGSGVSRGSGGSSRGGGAMVVRVGRAGGAVASVAVQEGEMRGQFWEVIQRLSATLPDQDPNNQADAIPGEILGRRRPLKEHVELRGFLPLADLYKQRYAMDGPAVPAVPDDCAGSVRIRGLKAFAAAVSGEPFLPAHQALHYQGDTMMATKGREQSEYQWSEASGGSGSHHMSQQSHESSRHHLEYSLRQGQPRSQYGRTMPGMGSSGGSTRSVGERSSRSLSGPLGTGYLGSGVRVGGGSEGGARRSSRGPSPAPQGPSQHARAASIGGLRSGAGPQQQQHIPVGSLARHHSQPMLAPPAPGNAGSNLGGAGGSDIDLSGKYPHPPLHRVQQQGSGVTALPLVSSSHRMYSSRHSDGPSLSSSRHSLDSGIRQYESANNSSRHSDQRTSGYHNPDAGGPGQSMASNSGSGSGSSGLSAHDTRSLGAWSAPPGRSGGGVGSVGGGGGSWAAEHEPRSSFRGDEGSGDESDMMFVTPSFGGQHRRRSTGGGGGPVVGGGGGSGGGRDGFTPGGNGRGDDVDFGGVGGGAGGSDLGSAGSPQFGSSRASGGLLGGGLWSSGASFPAQDLALSPQAALDHAEDGERSGAEHSLFGSTSWRGAIGSSGGANTPIGTPVSAPLDASTGSRGHTPTPSSPADLIGRSRDQSLSSSGYGGPDGGLGEHASDRGMSQRRQQGHEHEHEHNRTRSLDHRASGERGGGVGYLNYPFVPRQPHQSQQQGYPSHQQQDRQDSMQSTAAQQVTYGSDQSRHIVSHRRQGSTGTMHSARSSPPGFSDIIPGSPTIGQNWNSGGIDRGSLQGNADRIFRDEDSPGTARDQQHHRRFSYSGPQVVSTGLRSGAAPPSYQSRGHNQQSPQGHQQQPIEQSPPGQQQQHHHDTSMYHRRASSPRIAARGSPADELSTPGGGSPIPNNSGRQHLQGQGRPPSNLPSGPYGSAGAPGAVSVGSSMTNNPPNPEDGASSIFSSNRSAHSTFSGFSGFSYTPFGGSDLGSVSGAGGPLGSGGGGGGSGTSNIVSTALPWNTRISSSSLPKNDPGSSPLNGLPEEEVSRRGSDGSSGSYAAAHGSTGGALGWGAVIDSRSTGAESGGRGGGQR